MSSEGSCVRLRLLVPLLAAATFLLLVVFYSHISTWHDLAQQLITENRTIDEDTEAAPETTTSSFVARWPNSTCGATATARGPHQRVVTYSFYGDVNHTRGYFTGVERNAAIIRELYPGWTMRVYHDVTPGDSIASMELERLSGEFENLDLCYVGDIPGRGDIRDTQQNTWRFLPMADPLVDVFASRDLDAVPLEREAVAVREWLDSNVTFHVMRDHWQHGIGMLAGMWGARPDLKREALRTMAEAITAHPKGKKGLDQSLLSKHVWRAAKGDVAQHDSFFCEKFRSHGHMWAFPTRRNVTAGYNFVGNRFGVDTKPIKKKCPAKCRPAHHQDWEYC